MSGVDYFPVGRRFQSFLPFMPKGLAAYEADDLGRAIACASPGTFTGTRRRVWAPLLVCEQLISYNVVCCRQQR